MVLPEMRTVHEAVILAAGAGSRLRPVSAGVPKPLLAVHGRPIIARTLEMMATVGVQRATVIVGYEKEALVRGIEGLVPDGLELRFIANPQWEKQNGLSLMQAAGHVHGPFLLAMGDHCFAAEIFERLVAAAVPWELNLAVDRRLAAVFDLAEAMKVETRGDRILSIGKRLPRFDAVDTGLFLCPAMIFDYLQLAAAGGDCGLKDAVQAMADSGKARVVDIGDAYWQDIDTPEMLAYAETGLTRALL